jgi:arylsulfatase A-like enzyme
MNIGSNHPFKGFKGSLWEGGHRVPAIAYWKNRLQPKLNDDLVLTMDLFPTIVEVVGGSKDELISMDGVSFEKILFSDSSLHHRPVFWRYRNQTSVRQDEWKLLRIDDEFQLFNLERDPGERNNLVEIHSEITQSLKLLLEEWIQEMDQYQARTE